jgi:hypothetical protein
MIRIAFVGAGSVTFTRQLLRDIFSFPELGDVRIALHDIDAERLSVAKALAHRTAERHGVKPQIVASADRSTPGPRERPPRWTPTTIRPARGGSLLGCWPPATCCCPTRPRPSRWPGRSAPMGRLPAGRGPETAAIRWPAPS